MTELRVVAAQPNSFACVAVLLQSGAALATVTHTVQSAEGVMTFLGAELNPIVRPGTVYDKSLTVNQLSSGSTKFSVVDTNHSNLPAGLLWTVTYLVGDVSEGTYPIGGTAPADLPVTTCAADCNGDAAVSLGELQLCINEFLGSRLCNASDPSLSCPVADSDTNGQVSLGEVERCALAFMVGCGSSSGSPAVRPMPSAPE